MTTYLKTNWRSDDADFIDTNRIINNFNRLMSKDKKKKLITKRQCNEKICATIDEVFNNRIDTIFCKIEEKVEIYKT